MASINLKGKLFNLDTPSVMGIVNITPDSFYSESRTSSEKQITERIEQILDEGATFIDLGAQSTNSKSTFLTMEEEWQRLEVALSITRKYFHSANISVDTFYSEIAKRAVNDYGVAMINDISAGTLDGNMFQTIADLQVPYVIMHMRGTPQTMQAMTKYNNFLQEILYFFSERIDKLTLLGVNDIIIDPGFGFAKTLSQNYKLMGALRVFKTFDCPLLVGVSRKSMTYKLLDKTPNEALNGTTALHSYALSNGASILRVHDVKEAMETVKIISEVNKYKLGR